MAQQIKEVEAIANNPAPPTFENTFVALERSGQLLDARDAAFNCVTQREYRTDACKRCRSTKRRALAAHAGCDLPERETLCADQGNLRPARIARPRSRIAAAGGVRLPAVCEGRRESSEADKDKLKKLNEEESTLENTFMTKLLAATKAGAFSTTD